MASQAQFDISLRLRYEQRCPDCNQDDFVEDHASGDMICRNCGVVVESRIIDERSEWRTFSDKDKEGADPTRVGGPINPLLRDGGLSTMIGGGKGVDKALTNNLQRMQARTEAGQDRTLIAAFKEVGRVCSAMKLPDVVKHQANEYYRDAQEKSKAVKGRQQAAVIAAVVFLACRQTGYPRLFKEICAFVPKASKGDIAKIYKGIVADLKLKEKASFKSEVGAIHPENYLRRFMSNLGFNNTDMVAAVALANATLPREGPGVQEHKSWHGRSPVTLAGTMIYIITNLPNASKKVSLTDICNVCGMSEITIKAVYKELGPHLRQLISAAGNFVTEEEIQQLPPWESIAKTAPAAGAANGTTPKE